MKKESPKNNVDFDVIIVGASFAGLTLAKHLPSDLRILILDRKKELNSGIESTGLITQRTKDLLDNFIDTKPYIPNAVNTIGVISPDYNKYFFSYTKEPWIYTTDTPELIKAMSKILPKNAILLMDCKVTKIDFDQEKPIVYYTENKEKKSAQAKIVVGADGTQSTVAKNNKKLPQNKKMLAGLEKVFFGKINLGPQPERCVYHFWFGEFSIGYGGWLSPTIIEGKPAFRVGLAKLKKNAKGLKKLDDFIKILKEKKIIKIHGEEKSIFTFGCLIPIGGPLKKPYTQNSILLGDASGLCGAFAADGIKGAIISGLVAAELIPKKLNGNKKAFTNYYPKIQNEYQKMMTYYYKQMLYRFVWNRMKSDRSFHIMYDLIARQKNSFLNQFCDSKDKNTSLMWVILKFKNIPLLLKYSFYLFLDLFKKTND